MKDLGFGVTQISNGTGIPKCTVSRELKRNSKGGTYDANRAQRLCAGRRHSGHHKIREGLLEEVDALLSKQYSPEQISGRLEVEHGIKVSHECLYQFIYRDKKRGGERYKNLRFGRKKRRKRLGRADKRGKIPNKTMIDERPWQINERLDYGHYEGDTIIGAGHQGAAVTLVERKSKFTLIGLVEQKTAEAVEQKIVELMQSSPIPGKSITFDNGTEFANHQNIARRLSLDVYFAHPYHSWERGLNENTNGLIRQYIPKKQAFKELTDEFVQTVQNRLNHRPRKTLGFRSPIEHYNAFIEKPPLVAFEP